jgi:hypothetical protein
MNMIKNYKGLTITRLLFLPEDKIHTNNNIKEIDDSLTTV